MPYVLNKLYMNARTLPASVLQAMYYIRRKSTQIAVPVRKPMPEKKFNTIFKSNMS